MTEVLFSKEDASVNFVTPHRDGGAFEARYVRREEEYFICYLSSHTGCDKACRFCHLTQTGQTMMTPASIEDYLKQARQVFKHYATQPKAKRVNFNFMARGEPLSNLNVVYDWKNLYTKLKALADHYGVEAKFNISTIMPEDCKAFLPDIFTDTPVQLYYSVYSTVPEWRRRWIPKAWSARYGMEQMKMWQKHSGQLITLHFAVIEGQNDCMDVLEDLVYYVRCEDLRVKFNLVRYNPYSEKQGKEPELDKLEEIFEYYNRAFQGEKNRIVPRVGFDVKASCGMFVGERKKPGLANTVDILAESTKTIR